MRRWRVALLLSTLSFLVLDACRKGKGQMTTGVSRTKMSHLRRSQRTMSLLARLQLRFPPCQICLHPSLARGVVEDCRSGEGDEKSVTALSLTAVSFLNTCTHQRDTGPADGNRSSCRRRFWPDSASTHRRQSASGSQAGRAGTKALLTS